MSADLLARRRPWAVGWVLPIYLVAAAVYIAWRGWVTLGWAGWYLWPLLFSEAVSIATTILYLATSRHMMVPVFKPAPAGRVVDVFIPTYNEPEEIVRMTTIAALNVRGINKVFVLDDGCRLNIRAMATALGAEYVARLDNLHAKAGNMNAGILHSDAEFMLFLDCDHVPQPQIVERTLGYFEDPELAFVQTPQLFYNVSSVQFRPTATRPLWNEQSMFYEAIQLSKNLYNAAFFCGSGALLRRKAIDSIGGFATGTATEDIHTSLRLHAQGWKSLFIAEPLAHGLAPIDLTEYHKQRTRWGAGSLGLLFRSKDSPLLARGLTLAQRTCYFASTFSFTSGLQRILYIALPAILLLWAPFHSAASALPALQYLAIMLPFIAFSYCCTWLLSEGTFHPVYTEQYNVANMFSHVMALRGILQVQKKFNVSSKAKVVRRRSPIEAGILILCLALAAAELFGLVAWCLSGHPFSGLAGNAAGVALFWNTANLMLIVPFLLFLRRHAAGDRTAPAVAVPSQAAMLAHAAASRSVAITRMDLTGATITASGGGIGRGEHVLIFDTAMREMRIPAEVVAIRYPSADGCEIDLGFGKLAGDVAVALTLHLFHDVVPATLRYGVASDRHAQPAAAEASGAPLSRQMLSSWP